MTIPHPLTRACGIARPVAAFSGALLALSALPASAQEDTPAVTQEAQPELPGDTEDWTHQATGMAFPVALSGFRRAEIRPLMGFNNFAASYLDQSTDSEATIYVFRAGIPDLSIWADRSASAMLQRFRPVSDRVLIETFDPPNSAGPDSGFRIVAAVESGDQKSTALGIYRHDDWIVKLRMSSRAVDETALAERMQALLGELRSNQAIHTSPPFETIADCEDELDFGSKPKLLQMDMVSTMLIGTVLSTVHEKMAKSREEDTRPWCRQSANEQFGIYAKAGQKKAYTLAFSDAGAALVIQGLKTGSFVKPSSGYYAMLSDGITARYYPGFTKLPRPEVVAGAIEQLSPIVEIDLVSEKPGTTIIVPSS